MKEFLKGVTSGVVGLMFSVSIPLAKVAVAPASPVVAELVADVD